LVYIFVLFGSFFGICAILGARVMLRNRTVRRFVRGIVQRSNDALERGMNADEVKIERPAARTRASAVEMQKLRMLLRESEKVAMRGKHEDTEKLLIQALTISPKSVEARAKLAQLYLSMGREAKAEALYRELLLERDDVSFFANLGLTCYRLRKFEESREAYEAALQRDPKNPERMAALGRAAMAAGHYAEAAELLEKASERMARDTELLHVLGSCYEQMGDIQCAGDTYRRINRILPYDEAVKDKIAALAGA